MAFGNVLFFYVVLIDLLYNLHSNLFIFNFGNDLIHHRIYNKKITNIVLVKLISHIII